MKLITIASCFLASGIGLVAATSGTPGCNANNCARGITGTRSKSPVLSVRQTDCSNFMTTTVYATPTATTTPPTVYIRKARRGGEIVKRDPVTVTGTFPPYATDCAGPSAYSSACSCWGYTATTVTVTTPTTTVIAPSPTCYRGLQWAFYGFTAGANAAPGVLPENTLYGGYPNQFSTDTFMGQTPSDTGVTGSVGILDTPHCATADDPITLYGVTMSVPRGTYTGLDHRAYFHPIEAGTYTFSVSNGDDIGLIWLGSAAVSGYTVANANYAQSLSGGSFTYTATGGEYVPIRIMAANAQGCGYFGMTVTKPDGSVILNENAPYSEYFLQYCIGGQPGVAAPAWPGW